MSSSLNVLNTSCNDVLSAESTSMVKEHAIETLGKAPVWTAGEGGSGGSGQNQMIRQNYPGLVDGDLPSASIPETTAPDNITGEPNTPAQSQRADDARGGEGRSVEHARERRKQQRQRPRRVGRDHALKDHPVVQAATCAWREIVQSDLDQDVR